MKSQNNRIRPIEMFLYLLITAPMISVPPVLPLAEKTNPKPAPHKKPPMIIDMKGSSCNKGSPWNSHSKNEREADSEKTPKIVLIRNLTPNIFRATIKRATLITK